MLYLVVGDKTIHLFLDEWRTNANSVQTLGLCRSSGQVIHWQLLVMGLGSKLFDPSQVESSFCGAGRVGSGKPFMVWVWVKKISPKNVKFFNFFLFGLAQRQGGLLFYCGS